MTFGHKNPGYTISGKVGDRKGIMGEKGVIAGFKAAKKQGCKIVVIDLDEHILQVRSFELSKYISRRKTDFVNGMIEACYVVFSGEAVVVKFKVLYGGNLARRLADARDDKMTEDFVLYAVEADAVVDLAQNLPRTVEGDG